MWVTNTPIMSVAATRWMYPADSKPPSSGATGTPPSRV